IKAVEKAGYGASIIKNGGINKNTFIKTGRVTEEKAEKSSGLKRLIISAVISLVLMYISMGHMFGLPLPLILKERRDIMALTQFLLTLPVVLINYEYFTNGLVQLFRLKPNMNSLIAIGSGAAMLSGVFSIYAAMLGKQTELYFDSAVMILTLIDIGKYLEARAKSRTGDAIEKLIKLAPETALVRRGSQEIRIPSSELRIGDIVLVKAGSSIPADGEIVSGTASLDESALTGESLPQDKSVGDKVSSGTVSVIGYFEMRVDFVGEDTVLSKIIRAVDEAMSSKAPIQKLADKVSGIFVPCVIAVSLLTLIIWLVVTRDIEKAFMSAVSVLVISCPCALGLATPTAITVGVGQGAQDGILIKSGEALEALNSVKTMALDKTGTITEGRMSVTDVILCGISEPELLCKIGSVESMSEHPVAAAIVKYAKENAAELRIPADFRTVTGRGVSAVLDDSELLIGNIEFMAESGVNIPKRSEEKAAELGNEGKTVLYCAENGVLNGLVAVSDKIKPDSRAAVNALKNIGLEVVMITGDNEKTAKTIASKAGIDKIISGVLPTGKADALRALKTSGSVAITGDGINDAPALAAADVGIAVGSGTDIAVSSADIVLMKNSLFDVVNAVRLSRATMRIISQNLFWALIYNAVCIPVAAGVLYPAFGILLNPMVGAAAMSLSSVTVVTNALRLKGFKFINPKSYENNKPIDENKGVYEVFGKTTSVRLEISGMMCEHCIAHVKKALESVKGVTDVRVSLENNSAELKMKSSVKEDMLIKAVSDAGYTVTAFKTAD
ncbi:MAG: heavy metal translocating P-type ATPase, partial [Clostridiales bacterium]|nr:heavy metal translocating P-type ATPase [Clostridiales bacterium]